MRKRRLATRGIKMSQNEEIFKTAFLSFSYFIQIPSEWCLNFENRVRTVLHDFEAAEINQVGFEKNPVKVD